MAKKKKKKSQAITMIVLFLVIIALVIGYFIAKGVAEKSNKEQNIGDTKLLKVDTSKAKTLKYSLGEKEYTLVNEDGVWKVETEKERPLDQNLAWQLVNRFADMTATQVVAENQDKLTDLGLANPALTVTLTLEDGATYSYSAGSAVVTSEGGCYAVVQGFPGIYILPHGYYTLFKEDLNDLTQLPTITDITSNKITRVKVEKDKKVLIDVAQNKETEEWVITEPYNSSVSIDSASMGILTSSYVTFKFLKNIDYKCTDFAKYGLDTPSSELYLEYYTKDTASGTIKDHNLTISIGNTDEDGAIYYVRVNGSDSVYTMSYSSIAALTNVDAYNFVLYTLVNTNISDLKNATFTAQGKTYELEITKNNADSNTNVYKLNGVDKKPSDIGTFYSKVRLIIIEKEIEKEANTNNLVFSINITDTNNKKTAYNFYEYDDIYYGVEHEGHIYFLVDKSRVDDAITSLENL